MSPLLLHVAQPTDAGVARCVVQLARDQLASGLQVEAACPPAGALTAELVAAGVPVHAWPARRSPGPRVTGETRRLAALIEQTRPGLVHLHSAKAGLAGRLAVRGRRPTVYSPHAWSWEAATGPVRGAAIGWERLATRWTSLLVCVSEAERDLGLQHRAVPDSVVVVPNGVDTRAYTAASPALRSQVRASLGLPDVPTAVLVGRLTRQKGQDLAVAAWALVRAAVPQACLVLVGDGPDAEALRQAAARTEGVTLVGARDDVADWYAAADVVLVPSRWEGMALTPLEAMARARSVVAADVTGVRESLPAAAGVVVQPEDHAALAAAVADRLCGRVDADAEGRAGRLHVERHHDARTTTAATTRACLELLSGSR